MLNRTFLAVHGTVAMRDRIDGDVVMQCAIITAVAMGDGGQAP